MISEQVIGYNVNSQIIAAMVLLSIDGPLIEGILKRYPEIGDRPKKVLSNP